MKMICKWGCALTLWIACVCAAESKLTFESIDSARYSFSGIVGDRVARNVDEWLLRAPSANPGMLEMFRMRDREPTPQLVPWAGEFVGKYLLSAIQALRMSDDPRLRAEVERVVNELIQTQAEDGYLGPFPKKDRLRGNWDLWGHYHCIEALLMWHEQTGDAKSLAAARRAGDLVCDTYLNSKFRVFDAGSHEMNMAIITALGHLHRLTGEARYLAMMREVEKDWERAGDYLRAGLDGREFFASPRPRWESLHDLQGLVELYRITGEKKYRDAFEHHWRSIAKNDIHNTGAFSSGEQATGNPYAPGAIETCCTVAWMAISIDMLRLTGDAEVAEYLERAFFNGGLGAQHPTGRWWTYNTPMDGVREASAHTIVFQSRAGTPELNCCSVNGPRMLGMLSEWAVMQDGDAIVINYFGPGKYTVSKNLAFEITGNYPLDGDVKIVFKTAPREPLRIKLRNPNWSKNTRVTFGKEEAQANGRFFEASRKWRQGDTISVHFDLAVTSIDGAREMSRRSSFYRGPILLAYDQALNTSDERSLPALEIGSVQETRVTYDANPFSHWLEVTLKSGERTVKLCDFATAGALGVHYRSWLKNSDAQVARGPNGVLVEASLKESAGAQFGKLEKGKATALKDRAGVEVDGSDMIIYGLEEFPDEDYSVSVWVNVLEAPSNRLAQIFSAWCAPSDDPLRIVLDKGKLFARIENPGANSSTAGVELSGNAWHHIAAVKNGSRLILFVDGRKAGEATAPYHLTTNSRAVALGGNPRFSGNEFLKAQFSQFRFFGRALEENEIRELAK